MTKIIFFALVLVSLPFFAVLFYFLCQSVRFWVQERKARINLLRMEESRALLDEILTPVASIVGSKSDIRKKSDKSS